MSAFLATLATIILHTPLWVWPLYAVLLFLGLQRTRDRIVPLWRELILPVVVSLLAVATFFSAGLVGLPAALLGLVIGCAGGWQLERPGATRRLPDGRLWLRGEWWSFTQIVLVLLFRYGTSAAGAMNSGLHANPTWQLGTVFISTALSGLFLGRTAARLRTYVAASARSANLQTPNELPLT